MSQPNHEPTCEDIEVPENRGSGIALKSEQRGKQTVTVEQLVYDVQVQDKKGAPETRRILDHINLVFPAKSLTAIMGSTGAGKTTLLNAVANRFEPTSGAIKVNGVSTRQAAMQRRLGYVMQHDKLMPTQTVKETMMFAAKLQMPEATSHADCEKRVENIISELGLQKVANSMVGSPAVGGRGLSGGERKRVSIALVLIPDPDILLLDEPTTGLDSFTAEAVTDTLRELAEAGRTVIMTIHQPSSVMFSTFSNLLLLANGRVVYSGDAQASVEYFNELGYPCPQYSNPTDYFMKLLRIGKVDEKGSLRQIGDGDKLVSEMADKWAASEHNTVPAYEGTGDPAKDEARYGGYAVGLPCQFYELAKRSGRNISRNKMLFHSRLFSSLLLGIIVGAVFFDLSDKPSGVRAKMGAMFFAMVNQSMMSLMGVLHTFPMEMGLVMREANSNLYSVPAYFIAKTLVELPFMMLFPTAFSTPLYFMIGLRGTAAAYFSFVVTVILLTLAAQSVGLFISAAAPSFELAMLLGPLVILPTALLSGFLTTEIPVWLEWLEKMSFIKWSFENLLINEFDNRTLECAADQKECWHNGAELLAETRVEEDPSMLRTCLILLAYFIVLRTGTCLVLTYKAKHQAAQE